VTFLSLTDPRTRASSRPRSDPMSHRLECVAVLRRHTCGRTPACRSLTSVGRRVGRDRRRASSRKTLGLLADDDRDLALILDLPRRSRWITIGRRPPISAVTARYPMSGWSGYWIVCPRISAVLRGVLRILWRRRKKVVRDDRRDEPGGKKTRPIGRRRRSLHGCERAAPISAMRSPSRLLGRSRRHDQTAPIASDTSFAGTLPPHYCAARRPLSPGIQQG